MITIPNFPAIHNEVSGIGNPLFSSDISTALLNMLSGLKSIINLGTGNADFAIISGLEYAAGAYGAGIVYIAGNLYYTTGLVEGKYLTPSNSDVLLKTFSDSSTHYTYTEYRAIQSNTQYLSQPIFSGNMDNYRYNLSKLKQINNSTKLLYNNSANGDAILNATTALTLIPDGGGRLDIMSNHPDFAYCNVFTFGTNGSLGAYQLAYDISGDAVQFRRSDYVTGAWGSWGKFVTSSDTLGLKVRRLPLDGWDMDANSINQLDISSLSLSSPDKIVNIDVTIIDDTGLVFTKLNCYDSSGLIGGGVNGEVGYTTSILRFSRVNGGVFDNSNYSNNGISRGWATIMYIE